jgi:hypothetical protein
MLFETQNLSSKCGTDFSIAAIMAKGLTDKKPFERYLSKIYFCFKILKNIHTNNLITKNISRQ